jgi:hypothetical protein
VSVTQEGPVKGVSHNTVFCGHRLRTPRGQSLGLLGSYLERDNQNIRAARGGREVARDALPQVHFNVVEASQ